MILWQISTWNGSAFVADGTIPSPRGNTDFETALESPMSQIQLADGSNALVRPETAANKQPVSLFWFKADKVLKDKLEAYINAKTGLRFTTHTGYVLEGYIQKISPRWIPGTSKEQYNLTLDFIQQTVA